MIPNIVFVLIFAYFIFGECKLSNDVIKTATRLMKYERVFSENAFDEDNDNILQAGTYTFNTDDGNGYATFTIPNTLVGFDHSAINTYDSKHRLVAINLKNIPEGVSSIVLPGFTEEEKEENEFIKIDINNPLPDEGTYERTSTRAVFQGTKIPLSYAIRNLNYRVPFSTKNMYSQPQNMRVIGAGEEEEEDSSWTIECGKTDNEDVSFGGSCGLNWSPSSDKPKPIHKSIPILIAGARVFIEGELVFEMQNDNGIRAGILINGGFESRFGLDMSFDLHKEAKLELQKILASIPVPCLNISLGKILKIGLSVEFGIDFGFSVEYSCSFKGEYLYGLDIKTPDSIFLGSDGGKWFFPNLGDIFNVEIVKPESSFKDLYDNLSFTFSGEAYISPFIRGALELTLFGEGYKLNLDFGSKFGISLDGSIDRDECKTFPYIDGKSKLYAKPFFRIDSPCIKLPFGITALEAKKETHELGKGWAWTILDGCLTDPQNIAPASVPKDSVYLLTLDVYKYTSTDDYEPFKIVFRVGNSTCLVKGMELKQNSNNGVVYETDDGYCSLQNISKKDKLSIELTTNNGILDLFGVNKTLQGTTTSMIETMFPEGTEEIQSFNFSDGKNSFEFYTRGVLARIPENFSGDPSKIDYHKKGNTLYSTFIALAGSSYFGGYLFNLENGDKHIWTSGGASVKYITTEETNKLPGYYNYPHDSHGFYGFNPGLFTTRKFEVTRLKNKAWVCNMGLILSLGRGKNTSAFREELRTLKGDSLVDYAGTNGGEAPFIDETTYTNRSDLERFDMEFNCWNKSDPVYLYVHVAWNNNLDDEKLILKDLCSISTGTYTETVDDAEITFKISETPVVMPVEYIPPDNQKVVSQMFAATGTISYEKDKAATVFSNPYPDVTDYLMLHIDIPMAKVKGFIVGLVMEVLGPIELLAPNYFLSKLAETDETYSSSVTSGCYVVYVEPQSYGGMYWIDIPFRYVKVNIQGNDTYVKPRIKFRDIFLTKEDNIMCNVNSGWMNVPSGSQSEIPFGCVSAKNGTADLPSASMKYTLANSSNYYSSLKTEENYYTIYTMNFTSNMEKYTFVRNQYTLDKTHAVNTLPTWIGTTARMGDNLMKIINPSGGSVELTAGSVTLKFTGDSLSLCPSTNASHKNFVDALLGTSTLSMRRSASEVSDATSIAHCPSSINSLQVELPTGCIFTVKERGVLLLTTEEGLGLKLYNSNSNYPSPDPFAEKQFYEITDENCSFTVDMSGSYTVKQVGTGSIIVNVQNSPYNGQDAVSFTASSPSGEQYPITKDIWDNETLALGLGLTSGYGDQIYLDRSGVLYVPPEYVKTSSQNANSLKNICSPYVAQSVEIENSGAGPGYYKNSSGEIVKCLPGNYCVDYKMNSCENNYYQPSYGASSCIYCGNNATSTYDRKSCTVRDGYYIISGEYGLENTVSIGICPAGYKCTEGNKEMCGTNEYQRYTGESTCNTCPNHTKSTADHTDCILDDGYYYKDDLLVEACPKGYKCTGGQKYQCNEGEYQPNEGMGNCALCSDHSTSTEDRTSCRVEDGYYITKGSFNIINTVRISICPSGSKCINGQKIECGNGEYQIHEGRAACVSCGYYAVPDSEHTTCVVKSGYYVSAGSFSTEDAIVETCPAGYMCNSGEKVQCSLTEYQSLKGQAECISCGPLSRGIANRTSCVPIDGYYLFSGEYGKNNTAVVKQCPAGYMCSNGEKTLCEEGYYQTLERQSSCISCGNFATSAEDRTTCELKDGYEYISGEFGKANTVQVEKCSVGHRCQNGISMECKDGEYQAFKGQSTCNRCGYHAESSRDKSTCIVNQGYYIVSGGFGETNDAEIEECPMGSFCLLGLKKACPNNTYQPNFGGSTCPSCGDHAKATEDHTSCEVEDGYYVADGYFDGTSNVVIDKCPEGYYCESGSTFSCPDGTTPGNNGAAVTSGATECVKVDDSIDPLVWIIPVVVVVVAAIAVTVVLVVLRKRKRENEEFGKLLENEEK